MCSTALGRRCVYASGDCPVLNSRSVIAFTARFVPLLLTGCVGFGDGTLWVSTLDQGAFEALDGESMRQVSGLDLYEAFDECDEELDERCYAFGFEAESDGGLLATWSAASLSDGWGGIEDWRGRIFRADADGGLTWSVDALDFSVHFSERTDGICRYDVDSPCSPDPELLAATDSESVRAARLCQLHQPHAVVDISSGDDVRLILVDTRNNRLLQIAVAPESSCAVVEQVLGNAHSGWEDFGAPNHLQVWSDEDNRYVLMTHKDLIPTEASPGEGRGGVVLWQQSLAAVDSTGEPAVHTWERVWRYPASGYLNAPHNVERFETDTGDVLVYAHSNGAGEEWNEGNLGSLGVAVFDQGWLTAPSYLFDVRADRVVRRNFGFLRDADWVEGERFLLADSGCLRPEGCDKKRASLWDVSVDLGGAPTGETGAWGDQRFVEPYDVTRFEGLDDVYEADAWLGTHLAEE